jgi:exosortase
VAEFASWSIIPWLAGVGWLFGGWAFCRWTLPSVFFLWFMMKLPFRAETMLGHPLRRIATEVSCWILQMLGQPAFPEGTTILLGTQRLGVAQACAGLRMGLGIVALAYVYILLTERALWQKVVLVVCAPAVAVAANCLRITATGLFYQYASGETAKAFSHDAAGWVMIPVAAGLFYFLLWFLDRTTTQMPLEEYPYSTP